VPCGKSIQSRPDRDCGIGNRRAQVAAIAITAATGLQWPAPAAQQMAGHRWWELLEWFCVLPKGRLHAEVSLLSLAWSGAVGIRRNPPVRLSSRAIGQGQPLVAFGAPTPPVRREGWM